MSVAGELRIEAAGRRGSGVGGAWQKLVGDRVRLDAAPPLPTGLIGPVEDDGEDSQRFVAGYQTRFGAAWVLERRHVAATADVAVWGEVPAGVLHGVPPRQLAAALGRGVRGQVGESDLRVVREGTRYGIVGHPKLVVRHQRARWECHIRRFVDVEMQRTNGPAIGRVRTRLAVTPAATATEISVGLLLLHGRWLNSIRAGLSNWTAGDPMKVDSWSDIGPYVGDTGG